MYRQPRVRAQAIDRNDGASRQVRLFAGLLLVLVMQWVVATHAVADEAPAEAQGGVTDGAKNAGRAIGTTVREVGLGAKEIGLQIGHGAADAGRTIGHAAKEAGVTVGRAAAAGGREFMRAVRSRD